MGDTKRKQCIMAVCVFVLLAACTLGACGSKTEKVAADVTQAAEAEEQVQARDALRQGIFVLEQQKENSIPEEAVNSGAQSGESEENALSENGVGGQTPGEPAGTSSEKTEQTAVYTQDYQDDTINIQAEIRLYTKGDELYQFDEEMQFGFIKEKLELEPEDLEEVLKQMEELFQEMVLDEYKDVEGMTCEFERRGEEFYVSIRCDITEETVKGIAETGALEVNEAENLRSFEAVCRVLEEQGYTKV